MSDRSYAQAIVFDCPPEERAACLGAIEEAFGTPQLNERPDGDELVLGERYGDSECPLNLDETIAAAIMAAAPGATFSAWVDPVYEYPGSIRNYAPDLGLYAGVCDSDGNAYLTADDLRRMIADATTLDQLRAAIDAAAGVAWDWRFVELLAPVPAGA